MASFLAKTGRDRLRVIKKKKLSFWFIPTRLGREFQKNSKEMQKIKKHHYGFISSQNRTGLVESDTKKKVIVPIHSNKIWN